MHVVFWTAGRRCSRYDVLFWFEQKVMLISDNIASKSGRDRWRNGVSKRKQADAKRFSAGLEPSFEISSILVAYRLSTSDGEVFLHCHVQKDTIIPSSLVAYLSVDTDSSNSLITCFASTEVWLRRLVVDTGGSGLLTSSWDKAKETLTCIGKFCDREILLIHLSKK